MFTSYTEGITRHKKTLGDKAVTVTGADNAKQRMAATDAFQSDPNVQVALCNLIAGGVGLNLTAATHVIFQDLDWVPANHLQAEDRYRIGQPQQVTVEYLMADGTLDGYIAQLLEAKLKLVQAVKQQSARRVNPEGPAGHAHAARPCPVAGNQGCTRNRSGRRTHRHYRRDGGCAARGWAVGRNWILGIPEFQGTQEVLPGDLRSWRPPAMHLPGI